VFSERTSFVFTFSRDDPTHFHGGDGLWPATFPGTISADGVIQSDFAAKRRTRRRIKGTGFTKPNGKGIVGMDALQSAGPKPKQQRSKRAVVETLEQAVEKPGVCWAAN
jgi:hypothetical protein